MPKNIKMLHISDLHSDESTRHKLEHRIDSFLRSTDQFRGEIDLVLVTGDIALSGKEEQYSLANEVVFKPLLKRLHVHKSKIFFCPGNHDIDRSLVNKAEIIGLRAILKEKKDADEAFKAGAPFKQLMNYNSFIAEYEFDSNPFATRKMEIDSIDFGLASLNTPWMSFDQNDNNNLYLSEHQVFEAARLLDGAAIKIAIMHHPISWLSDAENVLVISELKRQFDVIVTGHLHENSTRGEVTPQANTLLLTAPSLYNEYSDQFIGFNLYNIDFSERKLDGLAKSQPTPRTRKTRGHLTHRLDEKIDCTANTGVDFLSG